MLALLHTKHFLQIKILIMDFTNFEKIVDIIDIYLCAV